MNVLIACEESQTVCKAFRERGRRAFSCDIQECSGGRPEWHILGDVLPILGGCCTVRTMDGKEHRIPDRWDLIIAHPPCTYLTAASAVRLFTAAGKIADLERERKGQDARAFFMACLSADCERIAVENPAPLRWFDLPMYSQIIEPYQFGEPWKKRTCLWLKGLPPLEPTKIVEPLGLWVGATSGKNKGTGRIKTTYKLKSNRDQKTRSKTFSGIAAAMAEQWGGDYEPAQTMIEGFL